MNRLVGHHEVFAEFSLGAGAHLRGGVLDFTNDKASSVPAGQEEDRGMKETWMEKRRCQDSEANSLKMKTYSLLFNLLVRVVLIVGKVSFDLKVDTTSLK